MLHPLSALTAFSLALALHAAPASAGPQAEALGQCFVSSTTAAEKETISRWLFVVLEQQPEVRDLASIREATKVETDRAMAKLVERMVTAACRVPAQQTLLQEGQAGLSQSLEIFGQAAARKIFAEPSVVSAANGFTRYIDMARIVQSFLLIQFGR